MGRGVQQRENKRNERGQGEKHSEISQVVRQMWWVSPGPEILLRLGQGPEENLALSGDPPHSVTKSRHTPKPMKVPPLGSWPQPDDGQKSWKT